jgi:hypothetical protein
LLVQADLIIWSYLALEHIEGSELLEEVLVVGRLPFIKSSKSPYGRLQTAERVYNIFSADF